MKKITFVVSLGLVVFLAACHQTPHHELSAQDVYGEVGFNVFSDYREGFDDTNFNGKFDEGETSLPGFDIRLTPVDEKGNATSEALTYTTEQNKDPLEGAVLSVPAGWYTAELPLDDLQLRGGKDYRWIHVGPDPFENPPIYIEPNHRLDGFYSVACEYGGVQIIDFRGSHESVEFPCLIQFPRAEDGISAELLNTFACWPFQATVTVSYADARFSLVTLSVSNLPSGMRASFSPNPTSTTSTLTLTTKGVTPGSYTITIQDDRGYTTTLDITVGTCP